MSEGSTGGEHQPDFEKLCAVFQNDKRDLEQQLTYFRELAKRAPGLSHECHGDAPASPPRPA
tara:strand:+ start:826 stop:1011 length:186 start_codon:yes stop_codon:yes gene_type:complete